MRTASLVLIALFACCSDQQPQDPGPNGSSIPLGQSWTVPECAGGELAPVYFRGPHLPNSGLVTVSPTASGVQACAFPGPNLPAHVFLGQVTGCESQLANSECMLPSDCPEGFTCACGGVVSDAQVGPGVWKEKLKISIQWNFGYRNRCVPINCPDDCNGLGCAIYQDKCRKELGFRCHTALDECGGTRGSCEGHLDSNCSFDDQAGYWRCQGFADCD